jgi:hypothetical protein
MSLDDKLIVEPLTKAQELLSKIKTREVVKENSHKMDWLSLEHLQREILASYQNRDITASQTVILISEILGIETGRGFEVKNDY